MMAQEPTPASDGYTPIPNKLFDQLIVEIKNISELKVTLVVVRKTIGWHRAEDIISISQFVKLTGLNKQAVLSGIELAIGRGYVSRRPTGSEHQGGREFYYSCSFNTIRPVGKNKKKKSELENW